MEENKNRLTSGIPELDELLDGGFIFKTLYLLYGNRSIIKQILLSLAVTSQLFSLLNGISSKVMYVDGDNSFNPYFISRKAIIKKLDPQYVLSNILISRSFTWPQTLDISTNKTKKIDAQILLISGLTSMYAPEKPSSFDDLLKILEKLKKFALEKNAIVVYSTGYTPNSKFKAAGGKIMSHFADAMVYVSNFKDRIELYRLKGGPPQKKIHWKSNTKSRGKNVNYVKI
ncbi:MAG: hypothetical protein ACFFCM_15805 [Promethearchaeota archaeon]